MTLPQTTQFEFDTRDEWIMYLAGLLGQVEPPELRDQIAKRLDEFADWQEARR